MLNVWGKWCRLFVDDYTASPGPARYGYPSHLLYKGMCLDPAYTMRIKPHDLTLFSVRIRSLLSHFNRHFTVFFHGEMNARKWAYWWNCWRYIMVCIVTGTCGVHGQRSTYTLSLSRMDDGTAGFERSSQWKSSPQYLWYSGHHWHQTSHSARRPSIFHENVSLRLLYLHDMSCL